MSPSPCVPCGTFPQTTNIPGPEGLAGADGADGAPGFTTLSDAMAVPALPNQTVTVDVVSSIWMVVGMIVIVGQGEGTALAFPGPATFRVTAIPSAASVTLEWLDYPDDVAGGTPISAGAVVTASGYQLPLDTIAVYATGTPYTILAAGPAAVDFGTTDPSVSLPKDGTWMLCGRVKIDFNGAAVTDGRTITLSVRADGNLLGSTQCTVITPANTTGTGTLAVVNLPPQFYAGTAGEIITLYANVDVVDAAGNLRITEASVIGIKVG